MSKNFSGQKRFGSAEFLAKKILGPENLCDQKFLWSNNFWSKKCWYTNVDANFFWPIKCWSDKILSKQNFGLKNFGSNNSLDKTQTCKQEYALARNIDPCRGLQKREKYRKAQYVKHCVCFVYLQLSLQENVVISVCAHMGNAGYIIFIMWSSISGLNTW